MRGSSLCFGEPRAPSPQPFQVSQPLGQGVQGKLEVFGEAKLPDRGVNCSRTPAGRGKVGRPAGGVFVGGQDKQTTIAAVSRLGGSICPAPPGPKTGSAHPSPAIPPAPPQHWGSRSAFPAGQCLVTKGAPGPRVRALQSQESYGASDKVTGQKPSPGQGGRCGIRM